MTNPKTQYDVRSVQARTHGRVLISRGSGTADLVLIGFHGYAEHASMQMDRLEQLRGDDDGVMLVSIQALHRFYRGRTQSVVASWMTRENREDAIADNISYVNEVVRSLAEMRAVTPIVCVGFSQGVAMAFRAGVRGAFPCAAVVAAGGDVPPELLTDRPETFPPVLLARGVEDDWYTQARMDADVVALRARGVPVEASVLPGGHHWSEHVSERARTFIRDVRRACARDGSRLPPPSAMS